MASTTCTQTQQQNSLQQEMVSMVTQFHILPGWYIKRFLSTKKTREVWVQQSRKQLLLVCSYRRVIFAVHSTAHGGCNIFKGCRYLLREPGWRRMRHRKGNRLKVKLTFCFQCFTSTVPICFGFDGTCDAIECLSSQSCCSYKGFKKQRHTRQVERWRD